MLVGFYPLVDLGKGDVTDAGDAAKGAGQPGGSKLAGGLETLLLKEGDGSLGEQAFEGAFRYDELASEVVLVVGKRLAFAVDVPECDGQAARDGGASAAMPAALVAAMDVRWYGTGVVLHYLQGTLYKDKGTFLTL